MNNNYSRTNAETQKSIGEHLSTRSKQYRAKRIDVNVKVNTLAYLVEMLGGFVMAGLTFMRPSTYLYIGTQFWYGCVIPSCYLINSSDTKAFIMEQGWVVALTNLYKKREPEEIPTLRAEKETSRKKHEGNGASTDFSTRTLVISEENNLKDDQKENNSKPENFNQPENRLNRGIVLSDLECISESDITYSSRKAKIKQPNTIHRKDLNCNVKNDCETYYVLKKHTFPLPLTIEKNALLMSLPNQVDYS